MTVTRRPIIAADIPSASRDHDRQVGAAADGFLRGLPDRRGLRLILLDDAFAKVDDPTVAELMGLLVRLDLDFVMTGHALWGCYPQVPSVDVYEVRRREGGPAITTHVHWDGTTRHLQAAG